jgi:DNA-binding NarL/FixJ family response regulator
MRAIRVLLVEDYKPFLELVSSTLSKRPEIQIVGQASDGLEAVRKAKGLRPDLIVLDIGLPSLNGLEAARLIRDVSPNSKILFLTNESSDDVIEKALSLGACGYIHKARTATELLPAVNNVIAARPGRCPVSLHNPCDLSGSLIRWREPAGETPAGSKRRFSMEG